MWPFIFPGFLPKGLPSYFTSSGSHSHWRMWEISDRPDTIPAPLVRVVASYSFSYGFITWLDTSHRGFWFSWLCNPSIHLWMMNLLFSINVSYEQSCLVKLGRLLSQKSDLKENGNVLFWNLDFLCFIENLGSIGSETIFSVLMK